MPKELTIYVSVEKSFYRTIDLERMLTWKNMSEDEWNALSKTEQTIIISDYVYSDMHHWDKCESFDEYSVEIDEDF
jgi:hypothetical protein